MSISNLLPCRKCKAEAKYGFTAPIIPPPKAIVKCSCCDNSIEIAYNSEREEERQLALREAISQWNTANSEDNPLQGEIDEMKKLRDEFSKNVDEAVKEDPDVKDGRLDPTDAKNTVGNVLFNAITELSIKIMQDPEIINSFKFIDSKITDIVNGKGDNASGLEICQRLVSMMAVCMSNSAYQAILFYDDLLKVELTKQFEAQAHHINLCKSDIEACKTVSEMLRIHSNKISDHLKIERIVGRDNPN